jgi:esterase/lipase
MKKSMKRIAISGALLAGLVAPSLAIAAEVPQVPTTGANTTVNTGVSTEPMKVVKVKATKKSPAKKSVKKKATKKAAPKKSVKKRVRRSIASK